MTTQTLLGMPRVAHVAALVGVFGSIVREPCANNSFRTPLAEHVLLYMTTRNISIPSELTSTGCRDRSRKASFTDGQDPQANHADFLSVAEAARHSVAPTDSIEEHLCFFIDIFNNLLNSDVPIVSTAEYRRQILPRVHQAEAPGNALLQGQPHLCPRFGLAICEVLVVHNAQRGAECAYMGTWLEILDITHVILCGDDRFILCAGDHLSASFAYMYAIGQIAKQLSFVNITSQESLPVRRYGRYFKQALSLRSATVRSMIDCFRLLVPDNIYSANSFKLRGDIWKNHFRGILLKCRQAPGLTIMHNCSPVQDLGIYPKMNTCWLWGLCSTFH